MNKVMLVGRLTRDPELRTLPSGKHVTTFTVATNEYRGQNAGERTEYHACVAWVICAVEHTTPHQRLAAHGDDSGRLTHYWLSI